MTHRIILLGQWPDRMMSRIKSTGCLTKLAQTEVRGPVAFVGEGRIWAVGELRDVKPATKGKEAPHGYLWCFADVRDVESIPCANSEAGFMNGETWEPCFLQASAQVELNRLLAPEPVEAEPIVEEVAPVVEEPVAEVVSTERGIPRSVSEPAAMPPDYQVEIEGLSKKARKLVEAGQMGMVF